MNEQTLAQWEQYVQETAAALSYPPTPDVAGAAARRWRPRTADRGGQTPRLAWVVALVLLIGSLMAVPQVRAAVLQVLRVGAVTLFVTKPAATATAQPGLAATLPMTMTQAPTPASLTGSLQSVAGATTLAEAQAQVDFPLRLPAYPVDLGPPQRVYYQDSPNSAVILLWLEPERSQEVQMALYLIEGEDFGIKKEVSVVQETMVNDAWAIWVEGQHLLQLRDGRSEPWYFVEGNVLIWFDGQVTYRLESGLSLEETVRIAESLAMVPATEEE